MARNYRITEVPLVGFSLEVNPLTFGYREFFQRKPYSIDLTLSDTQNSEDLRQKVENRASKGTLRTILTGQSASAVSSVTSTGIVYSAIASTCASGACPLWLGTAYSVVAGSIGISSLLVTELLLASTVSVAPALLTAGMVSVKRLGERNFNREFQNADISIHVTDYSAIFEEIQRLKLEEKLAEPKKSRKLKKEISLDFISLSLKAGNQSELAQLVSVYDHLSEKYKGRFIRKPSIIY